MAEQPIDVDSDLAELYRAQRETAAYLLEQSKALARFVSSDGMIQRAVTATAGESNRTCSAFSLYYLLDADLVERDGVDVWALSNAEAKRAATGLGEGISYRGPAGGKRRSTTTSRLPNQYNSSIYLAGYAPWQPDARAHSQSPASRPRVTSIANWLLVHVRKNGGYASRLEDSSTPSAYLTFWAAAALSEWRQMPKSGPISGVAAGATPSGLDGKVAELLSVVWRWAEGELAKQIAYHEAALFGQFDLIELIYAALTCLSADRTPERTQLAASALALVFKHYFNSGYFLPSTPVIADRRNFRPAVLNRRSGSL